MEGDHIKKNFFACGFFEGKLVVEKILQNCFKKIEKIENAFTNAACRFKDLHKMHISNHWLQAFNCLRRKFALLW